MELNSATAAAKCSRSPTPSCPSSSNTAKGRWFLQGHAAGDKGGKRLRLHRQVDHRRQVEAAARLPGPPPVPVLPTGPWKGKQQDGSFTCVPKKGVKDAKKPEKALEMPGRNLYFTGKSLGCEKG